ncbi:MAG TPA: ABC transporter ATP-binding protein [Gemmatales bacterium]|nr:ABC transporter ATP-binding protein [Gemmatales bacterium]
MPVIEMGGIYKDYRLGDGRPASILKGIDLIVEAGEFIAVMGPSGAGKSTLMNIVGLLDRPTKGVYFLGGDDTSQLDEPTLAYLRNITIGFVFQGFNLLPRRTVIDNVALPLLYGGEPHSERQWRAAYYLEQMGLAKYHHHLPGQLSGGQQQRVAIARALVGEPMLIVADEPTGNLDSRTSDEIMEVFRRINKEGITIVLVTHEEDVASHAERLIQVKDGEIIYDGPMF